MIRRVHNWRPDRGTTLLEMLLYGVIVGVIFNICAQTLLTCSRLSSYGSEAADRVSSVAELERAFRDSVSEGVAVAQKAGTFTTGPNTIVIELPGDEAGVRQFAVWGAFRLPNRLSRAILRGDGATCEVASLATYPYPIASATFTLDTPGPAARLVTLELTAVSNSKRSTAPTTHRIVTALKGLGPQPAAGLTGGTAP